MCSESGDMIQSLINATIGRLVFSQARVVGASILSPSFKRIVIEARGLGVALPGDKVQLMLPQGSRTYTPIHSKPGSFELLCFLHHTGPGSEWASTAREGSEVLVFGPRASLSIPATPTLFVGDETSVALAVAAQRESDQHAFVFESSVAAELEGVLAALTINRAIVIEKKDHPLHCQRMDEAIVHQRQNRLTVAFTGNAKTIQALQKTAPVRLAKPYWAPGKRGLD